MLNIVAHDLRNPLSGIRLNAATLKRLDPAPESQARLVKLATQIEGATGRMDRLIGDLLDTEKIHNGNFAVQAHWENGEELLQDALRAVARQAEEGGVVLRPTVAGSDVRIFADYDEFLRVIGNVLSNAVKFSPPGGIVDIRFERGPTAFCFTITDQGPGIPPEDRERLFDRYWQAAESAHRGTGLGLFIAAGIVHAHGGTIRIESEIGKGSRFFIESPLPESTPSASVRGLVRADENRELERDPEGARDGDHGSDRAAEDEKKTGDLV
jgi:signal transduction histidine kinase